MVAGLRGLRPREPLRLAHDAAGVVVVETGAGSFTTAAAGTLVLDALARHDGHLDTTTLVAELADAPGGGAPLEEVARGIADLVHDGILVRAPAAAARRRVRLVAVGDVDPRPCRGALAAGGFDEVADADEADLVVVLCRDHGDPELATELRGFDDAGPVLLVRVGTARCWIGPLLSGDRRRPAAAPPVGGPVTGGRPDTGGTVHVAPSTPPAQATTTAVARAPATPGTSGSCLECLLETLRRNAPGPPPGLGPGTLVPAGSGAVLARAAAGLVAAAVDAVLDAVTGADPSDPSGEDQDGDQGVGRWAVVREVDLRSLTTTVHVVLPCRHRTTAGEPSSAAPGGIPGEGPDAARDDEGAAEFLRRTASLASRVTGVLDPVQVRPVGGGQVLAATTHLVRWRSRPGLPARWVRATASAVGPHEVRARAAATGEAVERYSASWHGDEERIRCAAVELMAQPGVRVLLPQDLGHHSAGQVAVGEGPAPLPHDLVTDFSPVRRLTGPFAGTTTGAGSGSVWIASGAAFFGHTDDDVSVFTRPDSNGCAVGSTFAAATASGLLELVERDAVALWWWPRAERPGLDLAVLGSARPALEEELHRRGRRLWLLDVTTDVGVPVVVAVGGRHDGTGPLFGFGAHLDHARAAHRAVRELLQVVVSVEDAGGVPAGASGWDAVPVEDVPHVVPHGEAAVVLPGPGGSGASQDLDELVARVARAEVEAFVLDLTRPETGVPAVRVVAPALRPWYRRLGPGRLVLTGPPNPWTLPV